MRKTVNKTKIFIEINNNTINEFKFFVVTCRKITEDLKITSNT